MRMRFSLDLHSTPVALADLDSRCTNLFVFGQEMFGEPDGKQFDFVGQLFVRENIDRILDRVRRNDLCVVAAGVRRFEIALEHCCDVNLLD